MKADKSLLAGSTSLLVLALLAEGDQYGYQIITTLDQRSKGVFALKEGTLYPILHSLERENCVTCYEQEAPTGRMRKYYRLTDKGRRALTEKSESWRYLAQTVSQLLAQSEQARPEPSHGI